LVAARHRRVGIIGGGERADVTVRESFERARTFLGEVNQEVRRVTWPTPREIAGATAVVLAATALLALLLAIYDLLVSNVLNVILR